LVRKALLTLAVIACSACSEVTSPDGQMLEARSRSWTDLWSTGSCTTGGSSSELTVLRLAPWAPPLTTYDTTFIAVQGRPSTHAIYFVRQPWMAQSMKYMELEIPPGAEFVDAAGVAVPRGAVVPITVHADSATVSFEFGPHGSSFSTRKPATLSVSWWFADLGSLPADGLKIWYQAGAADPWSPLSTQVDLSLKYITAPIYHFSNYAVAW
jgi:hypothetical protein